MLVFGQDHGSKIASGVTHSRGLLNSTCSWTPDLHFRFLVLNTRDINRSRPDQAVFKITDKCYRTARHDECSKIFLNFSQVNLYQTPRSLVMPSILLSARSVLPDTPCPGKSGRRPPHILFPRYFKTDLELVKDDSPRAWDRSLR